METRTDGEPTQRLIYAPGLLGPIAELATADREETRYVYASRINVPDYMVRGGRTFRFVTDQLGSVRFVTDSNTGEIAQEITYDPFGEVVSDSAPGFQPFGFAGGLYSSDTGLTHFGAREYDAGLGRWTSTDPISFAGGDTNLYGYVIQDPVNLIDPTGWFSITGALNNYANWANRNQSFEYGSNYAAGALNSLTGGISNTLAGVDGSCAGPGYGLGSVVGMAGSSFQGVVGAGAAMQRNVQAATGVLVSGRAAVANGVAATSALNFGLYGINTSLQQEMPPSSCGC